MKITEETWSISAAWPHSVLLWLVWLQLLKPKETLSENNEWVLPLLNLDFTRITVKWSGKSAVSEGGGRLHGEKEVQFPDKQTSISRLLSLTHRQRCVWTWTFMEPRVWLLCHFGLRLWIWNTHPIQAAQVLHHVLISVSVVVDHSVLFVHTARLKQTSKHDQSSISELFISRTYSKRYQVICFSESFKYGNIHWI